MSILGDPGADSGGERKSKRAGKYGTKKSKERREEPVGTMSYQTSSKRSPPFCLLIGQKNTNVFWHQSETRTMVTVWNWSDKTLSLGALLDILFFSLCHIFNSLRTDEIKLWLTLSAKQRRNPCSGLPAVYPDLSTHHDWPVKKDLCFVCRKTGNSQSG